MYTFILAESALETVPKELWDDASIASEAKRLKRRPGELLLDSSRHPAAMRKLKDWRKRGRPDIAHFCALLALDSKLNQSGKMRLYVHTMNDQVVKFDPGVRIPRVYNRFCGLMQDLFRRKHIEYEGKTLLELEDKTVGKLVKELPRRTRVIVLDASGEKTTLTGLSKKIRGKDACFVLGGFPHGVFDSPELKRLPKASLSDIELCAWTVLADAIAACEVADE